MFTSTIQDILAIRLQYLPELIMAASLRHDIDDLVAKFLPSGNVAVVDDARTSTAYGDQVFRALTGRFEANHIMLPLGVKADEDALLEIEQKSKRADLLVAVGSGTINDLVKRASFKAGKPYIIFPTAASMNGYVSKNASISVAGHKETQEAQMPLAVLVDMQVIMDAPLRLTQAGLGDCLARPTAQADWLLSHYLLGTDYDAAPFKMIAEYEEMVFAQAGAILHADREVMEALFKLILVSGFGMTIAGSSAPASGAEHMIAHLMSTGEHLHGEEIAVTTLDMATRQARMLGLTKLRCAPADVHGDKGYMKKREAIMQRFPDGMVPSALWQQAREAIATIHIEPQKLAAIRKQAGLPDDAEKLGWNAEDYRECIEQARFSRDRFTCLDVMA